MNTSKVLLGLAVFGAAVSWSSNAEAKAKGPLEGQPAVRKRMQLRRFRFQIEPYIGMSLSQPFVHMGYVGGKMTFHFADWIAIRGTFGYGVLPLESRLLKSVNDGGLPTGIAPGELDPGPGGQVCPEGGAPCRPVSQINNPAPLLHDFRAGLVRAQWQSSVDVVFTPFAGKLGLFSALFTEYDIYIFGGLGLVGYTRQYTDESTASALGLNTDPNSADFCTDADGNSNDDCILHPVDADTGVRVGGSFGGGVNLFINDWVSINLEIQDIVVGVNLAGLNASNEIPPVVNNGDRDAFHNVTLQLGPRFYLPPKAKRTR